jgi:DNA-binding MurR/RpiR family transcriptional regulator
MDNTIQILEKIEKDMSSMTFSQKKVADFILKNPMQAAFSTVEEIARVVKVSTTTVVRLALTMKYSGYAELQKKLQEYLKIISSPSVKLEMNFNNSESRNNIISDIARQQLENINKVYANLSDELILQAVKKLSNARHIYVFGQRSCYGPCHYLAYNINRTLANCDFIYNCNADYIETIHRMGEKDVLIVMSMSRYIKTVVNFAEIVHKRGVYIIAISDGYASPLVPISDIMFLTDGSSQDFHNAMAASMFIAEVLIGVLAAKNRNRAKNNLTDTEDISRQMDINLY